MIRYSLKCASGCEFEGWFPSSADFDRQAAEQRLECPLCGSASVRRAIMAPAVVRGKAPSKFAPGADARKAIAEAAKRARDYVEKNFDYVGSRFPEEARRIHYGEDAARSIYGEATGAEVKELVEEGVSVAPLPAAPGPPRKKLN